MILLTCVLRAHNNIPILKKVLLGIEKVLTAFLILDKIFLKTDLLMYALRVYINRTLIMLLTQYFYNNFTINSKHKDKLLVVDSNKNK